MRTFITMAVIAGLALGGSANAQSKSTVKPVLNELTVKAADGTVYSGTMEIATDKGKISGAFHITKPTEITGTVAGTTEKGLMKLAFPYRMVERNCEGSVKMELKVPPKAGPTTGTMEAIGCGRDEASKLTGTVELTPVKK